MMLAAIMTMPVLLLPPVLLRCRLRLLGERAVLGAATKRHAQWSFFAGLLRFRVFLLRQPMCRLLRAIRIVVLTPLRVVGGRRVRFCRFGVQGCAGRLDEGAEIGDLPRGLSFGCGRHDFLF